MRFLALSIACLLYFTNIAIAQVEVDVIKLKNGDVVKGEIIKEVPGEFVKIRTLKGESYGYRFSEIAKITKEMVSEDSIKKIVKSKQKKQESHELSDVQKLKLFNLKKKSPATAVIFSALISSTGHAYAGNWKRGLNYTLGRFACAVFAVGAGIHKKTESSIQRTTVTYEIGPAYYIGMGAALIIGIWEMFDAAKTAEEFNRDLYETLYPGKPYFGLTPVPKGDGLGISLSSNF